jgi:hypothetical protein
MILRSWRRSVGVEGPAGVVLTLTLAAIAVFIAGRFGPEPFLEGGNNANTDRDGRTSAVPSQNVPGASGRSQARSVAFGNDGDLALAIDLVARDRESGGRVAREGVAPHLTGSDPAERAALLVARRACARVGTLR